MIILSDDVENDSVPFVNLSLIVINIAVFLFFIHAGEQFYTTWGIVPSRFFLQHDQIQWLTALTSMFLHAGWLHLIGNMWALYLFGDNVEDRLGHLTYLLFYLVCGLFAGLIQILSDPFSSMPCVGASGAIAGVMGSYLALHPNAKCNTWWGDYTIFLAFRTIKVPALFVIGAWFALQLLQASLLPVCLAGIAFFAHIGGFLAGIALLPFLRYRPHRDSDTSLVGIMSVVSAVCLGLLIWHLTSLDHTNQALAAANVCRAKEFARQPEKSSKSELPQQQSHHRKGHTRQHATHQKPTHALTHPFSTQHG